jgi:hypothetical protein
MMQLAGVSLEALGQKMRETGYQKWRILTGR